MSHKSKYGFPQHHCERCHNHMKPTKVFLNYKKTGRLEIMCTKCAKSKGYI